MKRSIKYQTLAVIACGILYIVYILVQQHLFTARAQRDIEAFTARINAYKAAHTEAVLSGERVPSIGVDTPSPLLHFVHMHLAHFNLATIYMQGQEHLRDPFSHNHPCFSLARFGLDIDVIGYLSIPVIDMQLPIYAGASANNLNRGLAHLTHSSFPVGGDNTNAVIAGHRSRNYRRLFRDIELLTPGDTVHITNIYDTILYVVIETRVIHPDDINALLVQSGRDLITLVTQYSRGFNRLGYRYIVVAERAG